MPIVSASMGGIPVTRFESTPAGNQWLAEQGEFLALAAAFFETETSGRTRPEDAFRGTRLIGMGNHSEVHEVGGMAVKLSTPTTGRFHWQHGDTSTESLTTQFRYLGALGDWLSEHDEHNITTPRQLFAAQAGRRHIRAEEYMAGWSSLYAAIKDRGIKRDDEHAINGAVKARIAAAVGHPLLRFGLADMGLESGENLHSHNVMVPDHASEDLTQARLCIIDQPSTGIRGRLAVVGLGLHSPLHRQDRARRLGNEPVPL